MMHTFVIKMPHAFGTMHESESSFHHSELETNIQVEEAPIKFYFSAFFYPKPKM